MMAAFAVECPGRRVQRRCFGVSGWFTDVPQTVTEPTGLPALGMTVTFTEKAPPTSSGALGRLQLLRIQLEGSLLAGNQGGRSKYRPVVDPGIYHAARSDGK